MKRTFIDRYNGLKDIRNTKEEKIKRGRDFECLINDVFQDCGSLIKSSYHTSNNKSEQIDGAIKIKDRYFLLEAKWANSDSLAASELFAFIGKVDTKLDGTLGIFISRNELKENFLNALIYGRKRKILVVQGNDVDMLFTEKLNVIEYLEYVYEQISIDNRLTVSVKEFIDLKKLESIEKSDLNSLSSKLTDENTELQKAIIKLTLNNDTLDTVDFDFELSKLSNPTDQIAVTKYIMSSAKKYYKEYNYGYTSNIKKRIDYCIENILEQLKNKKEIAIYFLEIALNDKYKFIVSDPCYISMSDDIVKVAKGEKFNKLLNTIFSLFNLVSDWEIENKLTLWIEKFFTHMSNQQKEKVYEIYLEFFLDDYKRDHFSQKSYSIELFNRNPNTLKEKVANNKIKTIVSQDITEDPITDNSQIEKMSRYFSSKYNKLLLLFREEEDLYNLFLKEYKDQCDLNH